MTDVVDEIAREVKDNKVVVYMKGTPSFPMCGFSAATVQVLREVGVPFKAVDVLAEPEKREAIKRFSNWPTIPQVYVGGKFIGWCDIVREMHARGELAPLLRAAVGGPPSPLRCAGPTRVPERANVPAQRRSEGGPTPARTTRRSQPRCRRLPQGAILQLSVSQ